MVVSKITIDDNNKIIILRNGDSDLTLRVNRKVVFGVVLFSFVDDLVSDRYMTETTYKQVMRHIESTLGPGPLIQEIIDEAYKRFHN